LKPINSSSVSSTKIEPCSSECHPSLEESRLSEKGERQVNNETPHAGSASSKKMAKDN
jgi:hypothetical protein